MGYYTQDNKEVQWGLQSGSFLGACKSTDLTRQITQANLLISKSAGSDA